MRVLLRLLFVVVLVLATGGPASARRKKATHSPSPSAHKPSDAEIQAATRLQVFLDRANFSPGRIDGRYSDLTWKALALYRESRGEQPQPSPTQSRRHANVPPDISGLDFGNVEPVFVPYTVTEVD